MQLSDYIGEKSKEKKRYCIAHTVFLAGTTGETQSKERDWCETRQAQGLAFVDRAEPEMGIGPPSRSKL